MRLGPERITRAAVWARRCGTFAVPLVVVGTLAHRAGLAPTPAAVVVLAIAAGLATLGIAAALIAFVRIWYVGYDGAKAALIGLLWGLIVLTPVAIYLPAYRALPALTQASTDLGDPPRFTAVLRERPGWALPVDRFDPAQAELQAEHYPALVQLRVDAPPVEAFNLAVEIVQQRGWRILDRRPPDARGPGLIEAQARTRLFAFTDDVVIRVAGQRNEARIDMRSASRFGVHDLGTNARRVVDFLTDLRDRAAER